MFETKKAILFDLDGTIYYGSQLIEGAAQVVEALRERGKQIFFLTNNSAKKRLQIYEKLNAMHLQCSVEEVYTSGYAAALYAKENGYHDVYIMGTDALRAEFEELGIRHTQDAEVVVVGYDMAFDYEKLTEALQAALHAKALIACNKERNYPGEQAKRMPGCGAMVGALEGSLGREIGYVVGKPNPLLLEILCKQQQLQREEIVVIGDTYESDIVMADSYGCDSVYIGETTYTGVTCINKIKDLLQWI